MINYFERNGADPCPKEANPAEWMLEVVGAVLDLMLSKIILTYGETLMNIKLLKTKLVEWKLSYQNYHRYRCHLMDVMKKNPD